MFFKKKLHGYVSLQLPCHVFINYDLKLLNFGPKILVSIRNPKFIHVVVLTAFPQVRGQQEC